MAQRNGGGKTAFLNGLATRVLKKAKTEILPKTYRITHNLLRDEEDFRHVIHTPYNGR